MTYDPNRPATPEPDRLADRRDDVHADARAARRGRADRPGLRSAAGHGRARAAARGEVQGVGRTRHQRHPRGRRRRRHRRRRLRRRSEHGPGCGRNDRPWQFGGGFANGSFAPDASGAPGFGGGRGGFGGGAAGLTIRGTVQSVSGDTVTIKTANGQVDRGSTGSDTTYNTQAPASATDVTEGKTVAVQVTGLGGGNGGFRPGASGAPSGPDRHGRQHHRHPVTKG